MTRTAADHGVPYFPAFVDLVRKRVVVVGGGEVATTKVRALLPCRPDPLVVVAPEATQFIRSEAAEGRVAWLARPWQPDDLRAAHLVFAATDDRAVNAEVAQHARRLGIPVLAVDDVPNCDFIAPAIVRRGDVVVAISTGGRSPAMARRTRVRLDQLLPRYWGDLLDVAASAREKLGDTRSLIDPEQWQSALDVVEPQVAAGALSQATDQLLRQLERSLFEPKSGLVSLVGAGPGDPELLTVRAVRRLQAADAVVHDRLVTQDVLAYAPEHVERFDVGKTPHHTGPSQADIQLLLIRLGREGKRVVRLKGGDPLVFGRGGEEALALARAGVPFEIVPGISAALAAPAAAGIPVTHRGLSGSVTIATGHGGQPHDWQALARSAGTLVFLMAVEHLEEIVERLLVHGRPADEPAALVRWATTPQQTSLVATLGTIAEAARRAALKPPAVLIVGATAALSSELAAPIQQRQDEPVHA
jgi:uroporphyrin-III C-methyltransferase/precorrin-2 dehydrogenase/sirohydrochlorin ferrochelatase